MLLRFLFPLFCSLFFLSSLHGQGFVWESKLGGDTTDEAHSVIQTRDGGFLIVGNTRSSNGDVGENKGERDIWVVKLDYRGELLWERTYGGSSSEEPRSVARISDGGFLIAGWTYSSDGDVGGESQGYDAWVIRLDERGEIQWERRISSGDTHFGGVRSIVQAEDGGLILTGVGPGVYDYWITELDSSGEVQWKRSYKSIPDFEPSSIVQSSDGGLVVAGTKEDFYGTLHPKIPRHNYQVSKFTRKGELQWTREIGGSEDEFARSMVTGSDGGVVVAGSSSSSDADLSENEGGDDCWVVALDRKGDIRWERNFGGMADDRAYSIDRTKDGGFILAGSSESDDQDPEENHGEEDYWVIKLDASGKLQWEENFGGSGNESASSIVQTLDGGFVVAGTSSSSDGDMDGNEGDKDQWVLKVGERKPGPALGLYPNPSSGKVYFDLKRPQEEVRIIVRDPRGRVVKTRTFRDAKLLRTEIPGPPGLYIMELRTDDGRKAVRKVVKE